MHRTLKAHDWFHTDGFPIAVEWRNPQEPFGVHAHEFSELVIVTGGSGMHVTGRESWPLAAGDVFLISGRRPHYYEKPDNLCLVNVLFLPDKLNLQLADLQSLPGYHALFNLEPAWRRRHHFNSRLHLSANELRLALGHVERLGEELKTRATGFGFLATAHFMQIIGFLCRCYSHSWNPDVRSLLRIAETISHIETNFKEPVELEHLAEMARMSRRSFIRTFQAATGSSPIAYLIQQRVNKAAGLLRQTDLSITDIAFQVGFNDSNYFARQFRKTMGMTPRAYRQNA